MLQSLVFSFESFCVFKNQVVQKFVRSVTLPIEKYHKSIKQTIKWEPCSIIFIKRTQLVWKILDLNLKLMSNHLLSVTSYASISGTSQSRSRLKFSLFKLSDPSNKNTSSVLPELHTGSVDSQRKKLFFIINPIALQSVHGQKLKKSKLTY